MKKWRNDRRSERNLCNCVKKPESSTNGYTEYSFFNRIVNEWNCLPLEKQKGLQLLKFYLR